MSHLDEVLFSSDTDDIKDSRTVLGSWLILIVDDDPDVHQVTEFALQGTVVFNRTLEFLHAYSAKEGLEILTEKPDVCIVLLDVIMETPDAGLVLTRAIREDLGRQDTRIILRTGQPGQVPEVETITRYDINDYKTKSELTRSKLLTAIIAAVRSWQQIKNIEAGKIGLEKIIHASNQLMVMEGLEDFAEGVITQISGFLSLPPEGILCIEDGVTSSRNKFSLEQCRIIGAAGRFRPLINRQATEIGEKDILDGIGDAFRQERSIVRPESVVLFFHEPATNRRFTSWIEAPHFVNNFDHRLLEIFCKNVSLCAQNIELVDRLKSQAWEDSLLNIPNLAAFNNRLADAAVEASPAGYTVAVLDIDNFSQINDFFGHEYGDRLLLAMAGHLRKVLDPRVYIARIGSDLFGLLGPGEVIDPECLLPLTEAMLTMGESVHQVSLCIGCVCLGDASPEPDALKNASIALKRAKTEGLGHLVEYNRNIGREIRHNNKLLSELRSAFSNNQLFPVFQPQFEIPERRLCGFEALMRWQNQDGKYISPGLFIPLAEQAGLMGALGHWILRASLLSCREIMDAGYSGFRLAVNVSATQLGDPDFLIKLDKVLEETNFPPASLELEITESVAIIGVEEVIRLLRSIRERGVQLAIDDFGTGYSSLASIDQWPIDRLKIDRSFIRNLNGNEAGARIVDMVIPLAKRLSLTSLAEGVETRGQLEKLQVLGCDEVQGFLLGRPMDLATLKKWLRERDR